MPDTPESILLQQILKGQEAANVKLDDIKSKAEAMDKRVLALEYDKQSRDEGRTSREKWGLGLSGIAISAVLAMAGYILSQSAQITALETRIETISTYGTPFGQKKNIEIDERFARYGERDNSMDKRISSLETVTNDMQSRIK